MVLEEGSYGQTDILHEVQVTYQKKQSRDTLRIRDSQTASKEELFPLCFMNHSSLTKTLQSQWCIKHLKDAGPLMDHYALMADGKMIEGELYEEQRGTDDYLAQHKEYQRYDFISEGDTPSFLYLIDTGLSDMEHPAYGGWGSRFEMDEKGICRNTALDYNPYTHRYEAQYSLSRWFEDIQNDFAARIQWGQSADESSVSHYPRFQMAQPCHITASCNQVITLTVKTDGNVSWFHYHECDIRKRRTELKHEKLMISDLQIDEIAQGTPTIISLENADSHTITFTVPDDLSSGDTIHIITIISSHDPIPLKRYARTIITIE